MKKFVAVILSVLFIAVAFTGCMQRNDKEIDIVYVTWAEDIAMTNLAKYLIEDRTDYTVNMKEADVAPVFADLAEGNSDIFMDSWLPLTHKQYIEQYGKDLVKVATVYDSAKIGLVVPKYVYDNGITSIADLQANAAMFKNSDGDSAIVGIGPGAGIMSAANNALSDYNMSSFILQDSSEAAMLSVLNDAYSDGKAVVITGWAPHWMFDRWELKFLDDPENSFGEDEVINIFSRKGFAEDYPELQKFFSNIHFTTEELSSLMGKVNDAADAQTAVAEWAAENSELVDSWFE